MLLWKEVGLGYSVKDIAHPAGFRLFNNVGPETYTPTPPGTIDTGYSESPLIGHYLAYQFDTIRNPRDPFNGSCTTGQAGWDWFPCGFNPWTLNPLGITSSINCNTPVHNPNGYPIGYTAGQAVLNILLIWIHTIQQMIEDILFGLFTIIQMFGQ